MKYRTAATQIKEIPIVFRGTVDECQTETEIITHYDKTSASFDDNINFEIIPEAGNYPVYAELQTNYKFYAYSSIIYVLFDGVYYVAERQSFNTGAGILYYYGASLNMQTGSYDFSEYPFVIANGPVVNVSDPVDLMIATNKAAGEYGVTVWVSEPEKTEETITTITPGHKTFLAELTGNGQIKRFHCRFALGENGTLHIKPYVILNGNIRIDLCAFASNGDNYISGDNEEIAFDCYVPVETHAVAYVEAENVGEYESILDAAMVVQYEDYIDPESIVGYEGINLNRR